MKPIPTDGLMSRRAALALAGAAGLLAGAGRQPADPEPPRLLVAFVLRHAEAAGSQQDPSLSADGRERADRVGRMLRSVAPQRVMHSVTNRARETAQRIARAAGVGTGSYDMFDPEPAMSRIVKAGGVWVVVGHSNTVPDLVKRLGGDARIDVLPESAYDRIYLVIRVGEGSMTIPLHS